MAAGAWLVRLEPSSPMRIGAHAEDIDRARAFAASDTLFGALCWARRMLWGADNLVDWLDPFIAGTPPLRISSMLPVLEGTRVRELFFPIPQRKPAAVLDDRKLLKRAKFIDRPAYSALFTTVTGQSSSIRSVGELLTSSHFLIRGVQVGASDAVPVRGIDAGRGGGAQADLAWAVGSRARVTVDRVSGASALYTSSAAHFSRGTTGSPADEADRVRLLPGLIVLVDDEDVLGETIMCLEFLGEAGIGGERSSGLGRFSVLEPVESPLPVSGAPGAGPLLSLCWPCEADRVAGALDLPTDRGYRVVERSGWIASPEWSGWRSRRIAMLSEGSYLGGNGPGGGMVDVTPAQGQGHPVYRYGYGLFVEEAAL